MQGLLLRIPICSFSVLQCEDVQAGRRVFVLFPFIYVFLFFGLSVRMCKLGFVSLLVSIITDVAKGGEMDANQIENTQKEAVRALW